jgi:hypothetical protein
MWFLATSAYVVVGREIAHSKRKRYDHRGAKHPSSAEPGCSHLCKAIVLRKLGSSGKHFLAAELVTTNFGLARFQENSPSQDFEKLGTFRITTTQTWQRHIHVE